MSTYFSRAFNDIEGIIEEAKAAIPDNVDTLVGTGLSGAVVVPQVARALGIGFALVRKPKESTHSHRTVEGHKIGNRWCFVDDFIESGDTYRRVIAAMAKAHPSTKHVGSYCYQYRDGFQRVTKRTRTVSNTFENPVEIACG